MKNTIKQHYVLIVLALTLMTILSACSSGSYTPCSAYNCVELEITE